MFKNKEGFTLIELIIAISILAVIIAFTLPNITSTLENYKKEQMIIDAKDMVEKAKNYILTGKATYPKNENDCIELKLDDFDPRVEIKDSPYGGGYDRENSNVKVCIKNNGYIYNVNLKAKSKEEKIIMCINDTDISEISTEKVIECNS